MSKFESMITLEQAFRVVDDKLAGVLLPAESMPLRQAHDRILAEDQYSQVDLPPFNKSAMDGYSVLAGDERERYRVLETVPAGHIGTARLEPGTAVKVMTGAAVPQGAGKVIMVENTEEDDGWVLVYRHDKAANICRQGEDVRKGDMVLRTGARLGSLEMANLIACGISSVQVRRNVRITVISTGDEIVNSPELLSPGKIMNSNGPMLSILAKEQGFDVISEVTIPDDRTLTERAVSKALDNADIVILSGGVSVGEFDFVLDTLSGDNIDVHFSRIAVKPGKPTVFATSGHKAVFGLPGNPVSVYVMFHLFVVHAASLMTGRPTGLREVRLPLAEYFSRRDPRRLGLIPARISPNGEAETIPFHGSAHLLALVSADGFFAVPEGMTELKQGEKVAFTLIKRES